MRRRGAGIRGAPGGSVLRAALAGSTALALLACAGWAGLPPRIPDCPLPPVAPEALGPDFLLHQQVRVRGPRSEAGFTLVTEKRGAQLSLVALDRFGATAFALRQEGDRVVVTRAPHPGFPVPPANVLGDLARLRALGEGEASADGAWRLRPEGCRHETTFVTLREEGI